MREKNLLALAIIGVIIGAVGLGLGAFSTIQVQTGAPQGAPGDDGDDGDDGDKGDKGDDGEDEPVGEEPANLYYCSSQSEIEGALDTIGTGHGTLIITENITLSSTINLDGGGRYIIRSAGPITLNRNASDETFNVSNVQSLTIEDLIIDASNITSVSISGIYIDEGNDNPVYIQNVQIGGSSEGRGVEVRSENVWIQNCYINGFSRGISLDSTSAYCHILDNSIFDTIRTGAGYVYGIYLYNSDSNTVTGNTVNNIASPSSAYGIYLYNSDNNTLTGNTVSNIENTGVGYDAYGIYLYNSDLNTLTGNRVHAITSDAYYAFGIWLRNSI